MVSQYFGVQAHINMFYIHQLGVAALATATPIIRYRAADLPSGVISPIIWSNTGSTSGSHDLMLPAGNTSPDLFVNGGAGNRAFVRFPASTNAFQTAANFPISGSAARTFLIVVRCPNILRGYFSFGSPNTGGSNWGFGSAFGRFDLGMSSLDMYPPGFRANFWQIIALWGDGTAQMFGNSFKVDARNQFDQNFAGVNTVASPFTLGSSNHIGGTANLDIAELQVFNTALTDREIVAQMQALATYYSLPL